MPHPNKAKGDRWEHALARYLSGVKLCTRKGAHDDAGDLAELERPSWLIEAKDDASHSMQSHLRQAEAARQRARRPWAVVLRKARRERIGQGHAVMTIDQWERLRLYVRELEELVISRLGIVPVLKSDSGAVELKGTGLLPPENFRGGQNPNPNADFWQAIL